VNSCQKALRVKRFNLHWLPCCDHSRGTPFERHSLNTILQTHKYFLLPLVFRINVVGPLSRRVSVVVLILSFLNVGWYFLGTILRSWLHGCGVRVVLVLSVGPTEKRASSLNILASESHTNL
jgi:hypothetical protein